MAFLTGLLLTLFLVLWIYRLAVNGDERRKFASGFADKPLASLYVLIWLSSVMLFFWSLLIPPLGKLEFELLGKPFQLWESALVISLIGFVIFWFVDFG